MRVRAVSFSLSLLILTTLHIALAPADQAAAQAPDPLTLTLTAERSECTAGTLNPVSWTITGGTAPYTLTVAGQSVDPTAESVNVTCGALPEGASTAPATISAVVMDAAGWTTTTSTAYTIVPPLPAPMGLSSDALRTVVYVRWGDVAVVATAPSATADCPCPLYLLRWRVAGEDSWMTRLQPVTIHSRPGNAHDLLGDLREGTPHEWAVAALRDAIEQETPAALAWSSTVTATTAAPATGVRATATHDTITVTWDPQPGVKYFSIGLRRIGGATSQEITPDGSGPPRVVFRHLPPDTEYTVRVWVPAGHQTPVTEITVRTAPAPQDWMPLPRGPLNLRAAVTHESVMVSWDAPHAGARDVYVVSLFHGNKEVGFTGTSNGVTSHTFTGLNPHTPYVVKVTHSDIVREFAQATVVTAARPGPTLRLALTAERAECTAGTLNPVTWEIEGGVEPYWLTVDGALVDADAESATVTCGALLEGASAAPGAITATVTDATGATATASAAYTVVPPLSAPTGLEHVSSPGSVTTWWSDVPGVAELTREDPEGTPYTIDAYLVRYRAVGASEWIHALRGPTGEEVWEVFDAGIREFSVAALRHPLERLTPAALRWSAAHPYAPVVAPQNVVATATHDTATIRWNKQPHGESGVVVLYSSTGMDLRSFPMATSAGRHSITFGDLPPSTTYRVLVNYYPPERLDTYTWTEVTTLAPPPDYEPLPSGPQNLRATATQNSITVSWEASRPATPLRYSVQVFHAESGIRVDVWDLSEGVTSVTVIGTFWRIQPDTLYQVVVFEDDIRGASAEVAVTTLATPAAAQSTGPVETCYAPMPIALPEILICGPAIARSLYR